MTRLLASKTVLRSLCDKVYGVLPELRQIMIRRMHKDFKRPALLAELDGDKRAQASGYLVERDMSVTLTMFAPEDANGNADIDALTDMQEKAISELSSGPLRADDRALTPKISDGGMDFSKAYVDVSFHFYDSLPAPEPLPVMQNLTARVELRQEGGGGNGGDSSAAHGAGTDEGD